MDKLRYEQALLAMYLGHAVTHPGLSGRVLMIRRKHSTAPAGMTQEPYEITNQDRLRADWWVV